ncbi:MAG: replication restart helicase PriA [Syntrophomonadaceae bacterium]|jgi:primosomal protein N' (replication factor Y)
MTGVEVLINLPSIKFNKSYWYSVPDRLDSEVAEGKRVLLPMGTSLHEGYIVSVERNSLRTGLKPIIKVLDKETVFDHRLLEVAQWMAEYYVCPVSLALKAMIPRLLSKRKLQTIIPAVNRGEVDNVLIKSPAIKKLMEQLWNEGEMSLKAALKITSRTELDNLEKCGIITRSGKYQAIQSFKTGYVYTQGNFDYVKQISGLRKKAPRQAEIMELINGGQVDCEYLDNRFSRTSISSLINKGYLKLQRKSVQQLDNELVLTREQAQALAIINDKIEKGSSQGILLYGVTGSGKTEVYIRAAQKTIAQGKGVIVLVPEIALTRHLVSSFNSRFQRMAVLHSGMPPTERYDEWRRIKQGEVDLVLGTRSAVFAPLPKIGLIVIDEEQETTYKQEETPRYHARDIAQLRARMDSAVLLLGSATPSVDTFYKAMQGELSLVTIANRIGTACLPRITIEDLRQSFRGGATKIISPYLQARIQEVLNRQEQTILFINRRGYVPITICMQCGSIASCPDCSVALNYHRDINKNVCHYCDYKVNPTDLCSVCGSTHIQQIGFGTQKLEEEIESLFPHARVKRLDRDTSMRKGAQKAILEQMKEHNIDILIGTQMVAKGLDFPNVSLVGVVNADSMLNLPDFRAAERCFQLIVQVAGRAGRGKYPGEVVIQTYNPENPVIQLAAQQDYFKFYREEIKFRKLLNYPPFTNLLRLVVSSSSEIEARDTSNELAVYINEITDAHEEQIAVLGPAACPINKIKNRYRFQVLVKCDNLLLISSIAQYIIYKGISGNTRLEIDINPLMTM